MRAVIGSLEPDIADPALHNSRVLPGGQVRRSVNSAREQEIRARQLFLVDPLLNGRASLVRDLELDWFARLLLDDRCASNQLPSVHQIIDPQLDQVAAAQLGIYGQVKQRQVPSRFLELQPDPNGPDLLQLQGRLLTDDLALVPRDACLIVFHRCSSIG